MSLPSRRHILTLAATTALLLHSGAAASNHRRGAPPFQIKPTHQVSAHCKSTTLPPPQTQIASTLSTQLTQTNPTPSPISPARPKLAQRPHKRVLHRPRPPTPHPQPPQLHTRPRLPRRRVLLPPVHARGHDRLRLPPPQRQRQPLAHLRHRSAGGLLRADGAVLSVGVCRAPPCWCCCINQLCRRS